MGNVSWWKKMCAVFVLSAATAIAGQAQTFTSLFGFDGANGASPESSLVQGIDGSLYGTTSSGGLNNEGTVFKITPEGILKTLHSFVGTDGAAPQGALVQGADGNFYGTTGLGGNEHCAFGAGGCGTVFRITPDGELTTLAQICLKRGCTDGAYPSSALILASDGNFYGTTSQGGFNGGGIVYRITPRGTLTTVYEFCGLGRCPDPPVGGIIQASDGNLYGTTAGGEFTIAIVFKLTLTLESALTTLHTFDTADVGSPAAGLVQGTDGNFYGTTSENPESDGTVFGITPEGTLRTLHTFGPWGFTPLAALVQGTDGNFYGTTGNGLGTVFSVTPKHAFTTLHRFHGPDGSNLYGGLLQATNGKFYGTTMAGGADSDGTIFSLDMGLGPFVTFVRNPARVGQQFGILGQGFTGTTVVSLNGVSASFTVKSDTFIEATVPAGATTGYVTVTTPSGTLTSNVPFHVIP
jgi:uncharacterized repeat protein (TIGR03803 family)